MRNIVIGMAMASTMLASPALARDSQWYVQVEGGPMLVEDLDFDVNGVEDQLTQDYDAGYDFGGLVGYDFGPVRIEAEASYREADADQLIVGTLGFPAGAGTRLAAAGQFPANGYVNSLSFMVNGLADFGPDDGLQGFVGGGVGVARTKVQTTINTNGAPGLDDSDTGFAWQILAGVRAPVTDRIDVGLKYRFFNAQNIEMVDRLGDVLEGRLRSHSLMGTPPAAAPAAPAAGAVQHGPVHRVLQLGSFGHHSGSSLGSEQRDLGLSELRQRFGHAGRLHRPFGYRSVQPRPRGTS